MLFTNIITMKNKIFAILFISACIISTSCKKTDLNKDNTPVKPPVEEISEQGLITFEPSFPNQDEPVTITFDATKGNMGLKDAVTDVYVHTGVITDKSTSPSDWKYVKFGDFNKPSEVIKMTSIGNNKYKITLSPKQFYGVPSGENVDKLAMVFRNADGSKSGRNTDNSDIYLPVYEKNKLNIRFLNPELTPFFEPKPSVNVKMVGEELTIVGVASLPSNLSISLNGLLVASQENATKLSAKVKITTTGNQSIKLTARTDTETKSETFIFIVNNTVEVASLPSGAKDGVTFINGGKSAIFNLYAPGKKNVYLLGDFNEWITLPNYFLKKTPDGNNWWIQIDNLDPNSEYAYQFFVDGDLKIADPYCQKVLDPQADAGIPLVTYPNLKKYPTGKTTGIVSSMEYELNKYAWKINNFNRPAKNNLVIYELHLRDFISKNNYNTLRDTLNYIKNLGINAIELMPINEFEGNNSWGYNPSFYFAPDKYYGTKDALKALIDECHSKGIAVIMDMVLNHSFGQSPMVQLYFDKASGKPSVDNPWFNQEARHPYNVGYDFNHESDATKYFVKNVLKFWIQEYKIDGYRFDLSKGFTQNNTGTSETGVGAWGAYDASRIAIWNIYNDFIKAQDPNNFYVILEHFAADQEEKELASKGMMLWNNVNHNFAEATMGYVNTSDLSRSIFSSHNFTQTDGLVTYMESHDEERLMFKNQKYGNVNATYSTKDLATALKRQETAAAFLMCAPGPKMIWQFGELGYDISIDQNGRTGEKPVLWNYNNDPLRKNLYKRYAQLIKLKTNNTVFNTNNVIYDLTGAIKYMILKSAENEVVVLGNFDVVNKDASVNFPSNGVWKDYITGETISVTGIFSKSLAPGEYHIYGLKNLK